MLGRLIRRAFGPGPLAAPATRARGRSAGAPPPRAGAAIPALLALVLHPGSASAHASEQGFVLLLPTDVYIAAGVSVVVLTIVVAALLPHRLSDRIFAAATLGPAPRLRGRAAASLASLATLTALVAAGWLGSPDPTANPLPIAVWTLLWVMILLAQGLVGGIWDWLNPWTGLLRLIRRRRAPLSRLARRLGYWPSVAGLAALGCFLLIDPAPDDPPRLALIVALYWALHLLAAALAGPGWLRRGEPVTTLMQAWGGLSAPGRVRGRLAIGAPGWKLLARPPPPFALAAFMIGTLALGSFDGLNHTFFWFGLWGLNPLEFAGRSSVVAQNAAGLAGAAATLFALYAGSLLAGLRLGGGRARLREAFRAFAPTLLPIAFAYHFAHYLPDLLVGGQFAALALNDPLGRGADLLGLGHVHVTTGFFNRLDTTRFIWLSQAGAVAAGHALAIAMSHVIALRLFGSRRRALLGHAPMAAFMVAYTLFGLWLLASPRAA